MIFHKEEYSILKMTTPIRKETLIVRLWTDGDQELKNDWRGAADFIGRTDSFQFQTLEELIDWMRKELAKLEKSF